MHKQILCLGLLIILLASFACAFSAQDYFDAEFVPNPDEIKYLCNAGSCDQILGPAYVKARLAEDTWYYRLKLCKYEAYAETGGINESITMCDSVSDKWSAAISNTSSAEYKAKQNDSVKKQHDACRKTLDACRNNIDVFSQGNCYYDVDCRAPSTCEFDSISPKGYTKNKCVYPGSGNNDPPKPKEICDNGIDDDNDGYNDCSDSDCSYNSVCTTECSSDADCDFDYTCELGKCVAPPEEVFRFELTSNQERNDFYMNGKNEVNVTVKMEQLKDGKWVPALGEELEFELGSYMSFEEIGSISKDSANINMQGKANVKYTIPMVSPKSVQWIGREYIPVQVKVWHIKDGKKKQGDYIEFEVYPPIYVKNIILNPKEIEEGQFAQLDVEISNLKDVEVYVYARSKRDLLNTERGTETASGNVASFSKDKKVRFYIYTQTGENSISFDSIPEHMIDFDQWKKDTMADLIHSGIDTGFSYSKYGKMAQGWAGDWGDAVGNLDQAKFYGKSFVGTPSNYSPMNWAFMGWDEQAAKIGASKTASEGFWNFMVLVVDGTKFTVGILSGSLPGSKWGSNARNNAVNAYFNAVKEMFKQTADATRVANSIEVQYPKVLFLELEDEDGYIITGKVPYYVIRHE